MAYGSWWKNESPRACACLPLQIFVADAHRSNGQRFVVRADEKLTAFLELESLALYSLIVSPLLFTGTLSLALTHHDPDHDDEFPGRIEKLCQERFSDAVLAREGIEISIGETA
jgi:hypothetical protein